MGRARANTKGSLTLHKDVIHFGIQEVKGKTELHPFRRWTCSCGNKGQYFTCKVLRIHLFNLWTQHLLSKHPGFDLTFKEYLENE